MILFSGSSREGQTRKRNQEMEIRKQSLTQDRVKGNFHHDDEGRAQKTTSKAGLESIKSTHPGGITPMLYF